PDRLCHDKKKELATVQPASLDSLVRNHTRSCPRCGVGHLARLHRTEAAPYALRRPGGGNMKTLAVGLLLLTCAAAETFAQVTEGSIRGYLRDEQGGVLPGVTVTATSPTVAGTFT